MRRCILERSYRPTVLSSFVSPLEAGIGPATPRPSGSWRSHKDERALPHSASAANNAARYLHYLRRPAALKIVSFETFGSPNFLSLSPTRRHKFAFGSADWEGTPFG